MGDSGGREARVGGEAGEERLERSVATPQDPDEAASPSRSTGSRSCVSDLSVTEVRQLVAGARPEPGDSLWDELRCDTRKGVTQLCEQLLRRRSRTEAERRRTLNMRRHERELWARGFELVAGVDEAGRGPLAGPVVAAAVILPRDLEIAGIDDSKKLSPARREELFQRIRSDAVAVGVGSVSEKVIDEINILRATHRAMRDAVAGLDRTPGHVLVDGDAVPELGASQTAVRRGDEVSAAIAAASIVAKVTRDRLLVECDRLYPGYGFARHKGYGTPDHIAALTRLGPCEIHRRSFKIVLDAGGGYSDTFLKFRSRLLDADGPDRLEEVARLIASAGEALAPHELSRLRGLYKRSYVRVRTSLTKIR
jgi:ribonuclease HII